MANGTNAAEAGKWGEVVQDALYEIAVNSPSEPLVSSDDAAKYGMRKLRQLLASWSLRGFIFTDLKRYGGKFATNATRTIFKIERDENIASGTEFVMSRDITSYSIKIGAHDTLYYINYLHYYDKDNQTNKELMRLDKSTLLNRLNDSAGSPSPDYYYINHSFKSGVLQFDSRPKEDDRMELGVNGDFVAETIMWDTDNLQPLAITRAIQLELALELAPSFGIVDQNNLQRLANAKDMLMQEISRVNKIEVPQIKIDPSMVAGLTGGAQQQQ